MNKRQLRRRAQRGQSRKTRDANRKLNHEMLERRELLAADLSYAEDNGDHAKQASFAPGTTQAEMEDYYLRRALATSSQSRQNGNVGTATARWRSTAIGASPNLGDASTVTWSIVPDGTGVAGLAGNETSDLIAFLDGIYGDDNATATTPLSSRPWFNLVERTFDAWEAVSGIDFVYEPNDDGAGQSGDSIGVPGVRGDIRIGGGDGSADPTVLAFAFLPTNGGNAGVDGDIVVDTSHPAYSNQADGPTGPNLLFHNTIAHEIGHSIGLTHVIPDVGNFLMEPTISTNFRGPQIDDILGAQTLYGDRFGDNDTQANAVPIGTLSEIDITVGGVSIDENGDVDWYSFEATEGQSFGVALRPQGDVYNIGPQNGLVSEVNTREYSDLRFEVYAPDGTLLANQDSQAIGMTETTATLQLGQSGTYTIGVFGNSTIGAATSVVTPAQMYSLELAEEVIVGPQLIAIRPDSQGLLTDGDTLNIAPREFNLLFKGGANLDESTINSDTIKLVRSGGDGVFGNGNDVEVALGYIGLANPGSTIPTDLSQIVIRPSSNAGFNVKDDAQQFPDDFYQIQVFGNGTTTLQNLISESANNGENFVANFRLDRGAQIVSVVPQPVTRTASGLTQDRKVIEVYFDDQELRAADAENREFYRLYNSVTGAPATEQTPDMVDYDAANNMATLTFLSDIPEGSYRLDIGQAIDSSTAVSNRGNLGRFDNSIDFDSAIPLGTVNAGAFADATIRLSGAIEPQLGIALPPLPGGEDDPGHRQIQAERHIPIGTGGVPTQGTTPVTPDEITTIEYYFPLILNPNDPVQPEYLNLITETEKQIVRDIFEVYARESGIEFIENEGVGSLSIGKGDLRALRPEVGPDSGIAGLGGPGNVVINASLYTQSNRFYGDGFSQVMYHEIGHALSLGHAYDQPANMGPGPIPNEVLPGDVDLLHLRRLSPPDSTDIDIYSFQLPTAGRLSAEVFAERLTTAENGKDPSRLNSALALYKVDATTGERVLVSRNDQYFGADAFLDVETEAGVTYFLAISSTGNTDYDLNVPNSGFGGTTDGEYELELNFKPNASQQLRDVQGTALDGDSDGEPGGVYQFWFQSAAPDNTIFVDKLADTLQASGQGTGTLTDPYESISQGLEAAGLRAGTSVSSPTIVRIVGNGGLDDDISTIDDNRPYLVGTAIGGAALPDGAEFRVPAGVNVMIDAGALIKMRKANIDAGSSAAGIDRSGGSIQILGTPDDSVFLRSYHDDDAGGNSDGGITVPESGDFGGIVFRDDSDRESNGIFLNYVNHADIKHGGGKVFVDSNELTFTSIHITNARPTLSYNLISEGATAAISASPDSFDDSLRRIGPDIQGNYLVGNSINGLNVRIDTPSGSGLTKLQVSGRFDDTDITHVLSENLIIAGGSGGPVRDEFGTLAARAAGRLQIDPGVVVKLNRTRIEAERGAATLIAEGTVNRPIVFTAQDDKRYGGSGSFDTNQSPNSVPQPGGWGGLYFGEGTSGSIDQAIITFGGGNSGIEGSDFPFNAVEIHQADVRLTNSLLQDNAGEAADSTNRRNGRGSNGVSTIYVRGAQPVIVDNVIKNNIGTPISINANSLLADVQRDFGRSTGPVQRYNLFDDNYGPLIRLNRLENNGSEGGGVNGMLVRGEEVVVESVWDDTDIVHVVQNEVVVDNLHSLGGLTLQSSNSESLVIKLDGDSAGFTATGTPVEIEDRIGGTIHVLGTVGHPVVFTSVDDDSVGAGFTESGLVNRNTNNSETVTTGNPGDWRGLLFDEYSNDRNVAIVRELENPLTNRQDVNNTPTLAQNVGVLAPNITSPATPVPGQKSGDDNRRLGFEIHGFISPDDGSDTDVYSFTGTNGTPIWIDIDRTDSTLDLVVELIDATSGATLVSSSAPDQFGGVGASTLTQNLLLGGDYYSQNYRDPGFHYVLQQPGAAVGSEGTFFIRVSSNVASAGNEQSRGKYQLQIRTQQLDEFPGSTVRFSDIRYAATGINVQGLPAHSPTIGEAGEVVQVNGDGTTQDINDSFGAASTLVNLLETDIAAIGLSGDLRNDTDVDWYQFDLNQTGIQAIGGTASGGTVAVVFDIDYADGAVSADTTVAVYDENQQLIYVGRESDVQDDQRPDGVLSVNDLTRGSLGKKDGYIGPIHLSPAAGSASKTYYVAVMSNRQQPSALNGVFQSNVDNATAQTRLEPVNSVTRIVQDHLGSVGYTSNGTIISPETGALFEINGPTSQIQALSLKDVGLYVATDVAGNAGQTGDNDSLYTFNPFTGGQYQTRVSTNISTGGSGFDDVQDIVVRSDGRMFGYQRQIPPQPLNQPNFSITDRVGQLVEIDPGTGTVIPGSEMADNIAGPVIGTAGLTVPNTATLADNIGSHIQRADEFTLSDEVDAFTFERVDQTGPASAPVPEYETYFSVRESDIASRLYRGDQNGNAAPGAAGANPDFGVIGDIQPAGVTFATQTFSVIQPVDMAPDNISRIRLKSRDAGSVGNFRLEFAPRPNNLNMVVNTNTVFDPATGVDTRVITLTIGGVLTNGVVTNAPTAAAITHAINSHPEAKTWVTAVIAGGSANQPFGDGSDTFPAIVFTPNVTTTVVGSDGPDPYGPLRGRVTGLAFGGYDPAGNHTGPLYGVTNAGELVQIDPDTAVVTNILESGDTFGVPDLDFQGLSLGPQNVEGGRYRNTLFAVTGDGQVVAFNTATQLSDPIFDTNVVTQTVTVAGGTPNVGYFTITSDAGTGPDPRARFTTVPIAHNAPPTLTINESQIIDTTGYESVTAGLQSTFTLSLVDDQGAITSLPANNINANNPVTVVDAFTNEIPVEDLTGFPTAVPFVIQIDNEQMRVNNIVGSSFFVTRGWNGTTAVPHDDTASVFEVVRSELTLATSATTGATLTAAIDDQATSTSVLVDDASSFAVGDVIRIGNEEMEVTAVSLVPAELTVLRGAGATRIVHHNPTSIAPASTPTAVTIVSQTLAVQDALPLAVADRLRVGAEDMRILSVDVGTNTVRVVRGDNGTAIGNHAAGTKTYKLDTTAPIDVNATLTVVQAELEALPSVGAGNVVVSGGRLSGDAFDTDAVLTTADLTKNPETIVFQGDLKGKDLQPLTSDTTGLVGDEIQTISLDTTINRGEFQLDFRNSAGTVETTDGIPFDASAAVVQAALELLPSIGVGNVVVSGSPLPAGPLSVQFVNELQDQDVNQLVVDRGMLNDYEVHTITLPGDPVSGEYRLSINDPVNGIFGTTLAIPFDATAAQVQNAIVGGIAALNNNNVVVTGGPSPAAGFSVQFIDNLAGAHVTPFRLLEDSNTLAPLTDNTVELAIRAVAPNTIQRLELSNSTNFGQFQLTLSDRNVGTATTGNIQYNATANQVRNSLQNALPQLNGNLNVYGGPLNIEPVFIEFTNELAGLQIAQIDVVGTPFFAPAATLAATTDQMAPVKPLNEIQSIELTGTPTSGDFILTLDDPSLGFNNAKSDPIPFDADAATVQAALINGIPSLSSGSSNIFVEGGPLDVAPIRVEFVRAFSRVNLAEFTVELGDNGLMPILENTVQIAEVQAAANPLAVNEIQQIQLTGANATDGQFTLSLEIRSEEAGSENTRVLKTSDRINYNDNAVQVVRKIVAGIPELAGQLAPSGGPLSQMDMNALPIAIEFINEYAGLDIDLFQINVVTPFAPAGAGVEISVPQNHVPQTPTIETVRDGIPVFAPVTPDTDGVLSLFDALVALPNFTVDNVRVSGDLDNPGSTVSFIDEDGDNVDDRLNASDFNINNFLMTNVPPFGVGMPAPYDNTNTTLAFLSNTTSTDDGLADNPILTITGYDSAPNQGAQRPVGLAFSPLDFNLWHPTTRRGNDLGHGINRSDDNSRNPGAPDVEIATNGVDVDRRFNESAGGVSLYFGLEPWLQNEQLGSESYLTYLPGVNAQRGILRTATHQDLSSNPAIVTGVGEGGTGSYNLPGGAAGSIKSRSFDLSTANATDRPTLYFSYFLETQNHPGSTRDSNDDNPFRDAARVWASRDGLPDNDPGKVWELLATNNSMLSSSDASNTNDASELAGFLSHLSDAASNSTDPRNPNHQIRQELFDNSGQWRQARVDLSTFAGEADVQLRFDFSTSGSLNDPTLNSAAIGNIDSDFGEFSDDERSIRSLANQFEGFYIDDIIVGFAERGEMVTGAGSDASITDLNASNRTRNDDPDRAAQILSGPYQLEVRRTGEYQTLVDGGTTVSDTFHTNDRHIVTPTDRILVDFESSFPSNNPIDPTQFGGLIPAVDIPAVVPSFIQSGFFPSTGDLGLISDFSSVSAYQVTSAQLGATSNEAGVIEFTYAVGTGVDDPADGLYFLIDGVPQELTASGGGTVDPADLIFAQGPLAYQTVRFNVTPGPHTFTWLMDGRAFDSIAYLDNVLFLSGGTGLLADTNREREQGQFIIESNFISDSLNQGIHVQPGTPQGTGGGVSHPGSMINFPQTNADRLVPGVVITNNVVVGDATGIRFAGETTSNPQRPVPFGRIVNNTLVGENRAGTGIEIAGIASPTLLNNLFTDLNSSINNNSTAAGNGSEAPIIRSNFFQSNNVNSATGTAFIDAGNTASPFVDADNGNYYLAPGSAAIDSGQDNEQDRADYRTFKIELGIPESAIIAPSRDVYGQLRIDGSGSPTGGGSSVFIDRGAVDRSDQDAPYAQLLQPVDDDAADRDPNTTIVHLTSSILENFQILLGDGRGPNSPFEGTGVDGLTVDDPNDADVAMRAVQILQNGELLEQDIDYTLGYNQLTGVLLLTPLSTLWEQSSVYKITLDNTQIADRAGNLLRPNQVDGSTEFVIIVPEIDIDFGDAPASYGTLLSDNGARHAAINDATPRLGGFLDGEADSQGVGSDDTPSSLVIDGNIQSVDSGPFTISAASGTTTVQLDSMPAVGDNLSVSSEGRTVVFEFALAGNSATTGRVPVEFTSTQSLAEIVANLTSVMQDAFVDVNVQARAAQADTAMPILTLVGIDDEDGLAIGRVTLTDVNTGDDVFVDGLFLEPSTGEVLSYLNPRAAGGAELVVSTIGGGFLDAWIDFNGDGDFLDLEERVLTRELVGNGDETRVMIPTPMAPGILSSSATGVTWARFRLSPDGSPSHSGLVVGGEVEDYQVFVAAADLPEPAISTVFDITDGLSEDLPNPFVVPAGSFADTLNGATNLVYERQQDVGNGTLLFNADGSFSYEPNNEFYGTDTFTYIITGTQPIDVNGSLVNLPVRSSQVGTVTLVVEPVNDAPTAEDKFSFTTEPSSTNPATPVVYTEADLLVGAMKHPSPDTTVDPYDESEQTLSVTQIVVIGSDGTRMIVADESPHGAHVSDGAGGWVQSGSVVVDLDDTGGFVSVTYTPSDDYNEFNPPSVAAPLEGSVDRFFFTVSDDGKTSLPDGTLYDPQPAAESVEATVTITVRPQNDTPTATDDLIDDSTIGAAREEQVLVIDPAYLTGNDFAGRSIDDDESESIPGYSGVNTDYNRVEQRVDIGPLNQGIAVSDDATGTGFVMFSVQDVFARFAADPPANVAGAANSDHLIAVRYSGTAWEYNNDTGWVEFTPETDDRLIALLDFDNDTIDEISPQGPAIQGIAQGIDFGDLTFTANQFDGGVDAGEFTVAGTFFELWSPATSPNDSPVSLVTDFTSTDTFSIGPINAGIAVHDSASGSGYIMFSGESVFNRFSASPPSSAADSRNSDHLVAVRFNGLNWEYSNNVQWVPFVPDSTDEFRLIASVDFTADTITPLRFDRVAIQGIEQGFVKGDLTFEANRFNSLDDDGEFTISGTEFEVPDDPGFPVGFDTFPLTTAAGGTVSYNSTTGMLEYTSAEDYYGPDSFVYWIADEGINVDAEGRVTDEPKYNSAEVTLYVNPDNDAPAATPKIFDVLESVGGAVSSRLITSDDLTAGSVGDADPALELTPPATSHLNERIQDGNNNEVVSLIVGSTTIDKDNVDINARYYTTADQSRGYLTGVEFENGFLKQLFYVSDGDFNGDNPRATATTRSVDTFQFIIQDNAEFEVVAADGSLDGSTAIELDQNGLPNVKQSAPAIVGIRVFPQNDPPLLAPDTIATNDPIWTGFSSVNPTEGQGAFTIDKDFLFANDENSPDGALDERNGLNEQLDANGDALLTLSGVGSFDPSGMAVKQSIATTELGGTIQLLTSGDLLYTPAPFTFGRDRFVYFATDQGIDEAIDGTRSASNPLRESFQTVSIFLDPVNQRPASADRLFDRADMLEGIAGLADADRPRYSITAQELLDGPPAATGSDAPLTTPLEFLEGEQQLSIVQVATDGSSFDVDDAQDRTQLDANGNGQVTLPTSVYGSVFEFDFVDFELTDVTYIPGPSYNQATPFASPESFTYIIRDDGKTTLSGTPAMPETPEVVDLAPQRSAPVRAQFVIQPVNEMVTIGTLERPFNVATAFDVLEVKANVAVSQQFSSDVFPGAPTSLDELDEQVVVFTYRGDLSTDTTGLFRADPEINVNAATGVATLSVFPVPFAVSSDPIVIVMDVQDSIPGDPTFVSSSELITFTVNLQPVNDPPEIDLTGIANLTGSNPSSPSAQNPLEEAYSVADDGKITFTLKEDITDANGVPGVYEIPYRQAASINAAGFQPIGLLDVFNVGPANEADGTPGGSQTLDLGIFTAQTSQGGTLTAGLNANGDEVLFYTPPTDYNNSFGPADTFTYNVVDLNANLGQTFNPITNQLDQDPLSSSTNTVTINLLAVNDKPLFEVDPEPRRTAERKPGDAPTQSVAGYAFNISSGPDTATDENSFANGQTREFIVDLVDEGPGTVDELFDIPPAIDPVTGVLTYQPKDYVFGTFTFNVTLVDSGAPDSVLGDVGRGDINTSDVQQLVINVRPVNNAPVYGDDPNSAGDLGDTLVFNVQEEGSVTIPASGASTSGDLLGVFVVGPQPQFEGGTTDPGGNQTLSLSRVPTTTDQGGSLTLATDGSGNYVYTPAPNFAGTDTFTYDVIDDGVTLPVNSTQPPVDAFLTGTGTVTITVSPVNDAPVLTGADDVLRGEDAPAETIADWATIVLPGPVDALDEINGTATTAAQAIVQPIQIIKVNDVDVPNDDILVSNPTVTLNGDSLSLSFEALPGVSGGATYELVLQDNGPNDPGNGDENETRKQFTIFISDDNDPPTFDGSGVVTADEEESYSQVWATNISAGLNEDSEQTVVRFATTFASDQAFLFEEAPQIDPVTGVLTFKGAENVSGTVDVTVVAIDSAGGRSDMPDANGQSPAPQILTIVIEQVDDDPTARDDMIGADEDNVLRIKTADLLANDTDPDTAYDPNEVLSVLLDGGNLPQTSELGASLSVDPATGDILYDPRTSTTLNQLSPSDSLTDRFVYRITDADGINANTDPAPFATVELSIQGLNDRPDAVDDAASVSGSGTTTIDVLANDTDIDGTVESTSVLVTQQPTNGSVRLAGNGDLIYTAQAGFSGADVIRYTVADNLGQQSEEATVTITVGALPTANPDVGGAFAGDGEFDIDVLSNDTGVLDLSSLQIDMQPSNGTVTILSDGTLRYTPTAAFTGEDTFSYSIADSAGRRSLPGEVTVRYVASGRQNPVMFSDVNADGDISPDDALRVINKLAEDGRDSNGIVLRDGIPIADDDRGPDFWDADGSQAVTPNDILFVLNQLAENAINDRGGELVGPSGELIQSDMIEIGTDLNRNGDRFEPVTSITHSTDKVVSESVLEPQLDAELIDLMVDGETTTDEDVATIDDVLTSLF